MSYFVIRSDHQALKYFLTQKVTTLMQQKWLTKLLGLDYEIQYKKGSENTAVDGLSRLLVEQNQGELVAITHGVPKWVLELQSSVVDDPQAIEYIVQALSDVIGPKESYYQQGILMYRGKVFVGSSGEWRNNILRELHDSQLGGHSGINNTYHRIAQIFF